MRGKIKTMKTDKGFGFIRPDDGGADVFFHATGVQRPVMFLDLSIGEQVEYDVEQSDRGLRAIGVSPV